MLLKHSGFLTYQRRQDSAAAPLVSDCPWALAHGRNPPHRPAMAPGLVRRGRWALRDLYSSLAGRWAAASRLIIPRRDGRPCLALIWRGCWGLLPFQRPHVVLLPFESMWGPNRRRRACQWARGRARFLLLRNVGREMYARAARAVAVF